jgi:hypothetical protein
VSHTSHHLDILTGRHWGEFSVIEVPSIKIWPFSPGGSLFEGVMNVTVRNFRITYFCVISFTLAESSFTVLHTITITVGSTRIISKLIVVTEVSLHTKVFTRLIFIKEFNFEIRETHRFIKRSLIDSRVKSDVSTSFSVRSDDIHRLIDVVVPTNTTNLYTITPGVISI